MRILTFLAMVVLVGGCGATGTTVGRSGPVVDNALREACPGTSDTELQGIIQVYEAARDSGVSEIALIVSLDQSCASNPNPSACKICQLSAIDLAYGG